MPEERLSTDRKALIINLNPLIYGTFAEIGAGQEIARNFFKVGAAAGTIAKTMSAYDMKFSDEIYGKSARYVSKERLISMLDHEYRLLIERLSQQRGKETTFFAFANTVSARNFKGTNECHGWMGVRMQLAPGQEPNDIIMHVRMKDRENFLQAQALGTFGVNLLYGAFYFRDNPDRFITSLLDDLSVDRIEVDMMEINGPDFRHVDNRIVSLNLLQQGLTNAVLFGPEGSVLQPSEVLYKKPVLLERGSFRPVTYVNTNMLECAAKQFIEMPEVKGKEVVTLVEITLTNLLSTGRLDLEDFLARADTVSALGYKVLVTNYPEFFRLPSYFRRYTQEMIGIALGINNLLQIFDEHYYKNLEGGILEAFGRLFHNKLKLLVYPMSVDGYKRYIAQVGSQQEVNASPGQKIITARDVRVCDHQRHLLAHLLDNGHIQCIETYNAKYLDIFSREVLNMIKNHDSAWESMVPPAAAAIIKAKCMFGHCTVTPNS
jgi:hypothetical protein